MSARASRAGFRLRGGRTRGEKPSFLPSCESPLFLLAGADKEASARRFAAFAAANKGALTRAKVRYAKGLSPTFREQQEGKSLPLWGGSHPMPVATASGWQPLGGTTINRARGAPEGKRMIGKKGKTVGFPLLVRPPRRRNPARDARAPRFALSGENTNCVPAGSGHPPFPWRDRPRGQAPCCPAGRPFALSGENPNPTPAARGHGQR